MTVPEPAVVPCGKQQRNWKYWCIPLWQSSSALVMPHKDTIAWDTAQYISLMAHAGEEQRTSKHLHLIWFGLPSFVLALSARCGCAAAKRAQPRHA